VIKKTIDDINKTKNIITFSDFQEPENIYKKNTKDKKNINDIKEEKKQEIKTKIMNAKFYAKKELEDFDLLMKKLSKDSKDMILFSEFISEINLLHKTYVSNVVEPLLTGKNIYNVPKQHFEEARTDLFKSIIKKYL